MEDCEKGRHAVFAIIVYALYTANMLAAKSVGILISNFHLRLGSSMLINDFWKRIMCLKKSFRTVNGSSVCLDKVYVGNPRGRPVFSY